MENEYKLYDLCKASYAAGIGFDRTINSWVDRDGTLYPDWDPQHNFLHAVILANKASLYITFSDGDVIAEGRLATLAGHNGSFQDAFMSVVFKASVDIGDDTLGDSHDKFWIEAWLNRTPVVS